jgi:hypothetical protein
MRRVDRDTDAGRKAVVGDRRPQLLVLVGDLVAVP